MKQEVEFLRKMYKEEKIKRQALESNKTKSIMLKELIQNQIAIKEGTYLDQKRDGDMTRNQKGNLMN